jgi:hypothetical protein
MILKWPCWVRNIPENRINLVFAWFIMQLGQSFKLLSSSQHTTSHYQFLRATWRHKFCLRMVHDGIGSNLPLSSTRCHFHCNYQSRPLVSWADFSWYPHKAFILSSHSRIYLGLQFTNFKSMMMSMMSRLRLWRLMLIQWILLQFIGSPPNYCIDVTSLLRWWSPITGFLSPTLKVLLHQFTTFSKCIQVTMSLIMASYRDRVLCSKQSITSYSPPIPP